MFAKRDAKLRPKIVCANNLMEKWRFKAVSLTHINAVDLGQPPGSCQLVSLQNIKKTAVFVERETMGNVKRNHEREHGCTESDTRNKYLITHCRIGRRTTKYLANHRSGETNQPHYCHIGNTRHERLLYGLPNKGRQSL